MTDLNPPGVCISEAVYRQVVEALTEQARYTPSERNRECLQRLIAALAAAPQGEPSVDALTDDRITQLWDASFGHSGLDGYTRAKWFAKAVIEALQRLAAQGQAQAAPKLKERDVPT